jgi:hypothetical protein
MFEFLTKDIKLLIFSLLDREDLQSAVIVCWEWQKLINQNPQIFKTICKRLWSVNVPDEKVSDWKSSYLKITSRGFQILEESKDWCEIEEKVSVFGFKEKDYLFVDFLYQRGIQKFPNSSPLLGNYAKYKKKLSSVKFFSFHYNITGFYDLAQNYYQKSFEADVKNPWVISNYATFLWSIRKNQAEAQRVLNIDNNLNLFSCTNYL